MKLFQTEVMICATLYILAESAEEANAMADELTAEGGTGIEFGSRREMIAEDLWITGESYNPDMPEMSLSPAMTIQFSPTKANCYETEDFGDEEGEDGE